MPEPAVVAANRLTAAWAARHEGGSTVFSGPGVWVLLAALEAGAAGRARDELEAAVGLAPADAAAGVRTVFDALADSAVVRAALAVGVRDHVLLEPDWVDALPPGLVGRLVDDAATNEAALNRWVEESTGGILNEMPVDIGESLMVLASAIAVRTKWSTPFNDRPWTYHDGPWAGGQVVNLHRTTADLDDVRVVETDVGRVTVLTVAGAGDVDVQLSLGEQNASPGVVLAHAINADVGTTGSALPDGTPGPGVTVAVVDASSSGDQLVVSTVAFDVSARHDLLQHAAVFGLEAASHDALNHFPGISPEPLAVDQAVQDCTAQFSAEGFVAAAVTAIAMRAGSMLPNPEHRVRRVRVDFDRPFGFAAVHRPSGLVLVAGRVDEPELYGEGTE